MNKSKIWIRTLLIMGGILVLSDVKAQQLTRFQFGIGGSLQSSSKIFESSGNDSQNQFQVGYRGGGFARYNFSKRFFGSSGLFYVSDRIKMKTDIIGDFAGVAATLVSKEAFTWMELPIKGNYIFYSGSQVKFFASGGVAIRRLMDSKVKQSFITPTTTVESPFISTINNYKLINYMAIAEVGCQLPLTSSNPLLISLSIEHTLRNLTRSTPYVIYGYYSFTSVDNDLRITSVALNVALILK